MSRAEEFWRRADGFALGLVALAAIVNIFWVLFHFQYGFDFSDEGYYLASISSPWLYKISATQFGFVYHPLYALVRGDIVLLRQLNLLITVGLAGTFSFLYFKTLAKKPIAAGFAVILASISLVFYDLWIPTPSYNSLNLQSLLIAFIGMQLAQSEKKRTTRLGSIVVGIGGWLAFMAKPPTALLLAVLVCTCWVFEKADRRRKVAKALEAGVTAGVLVLISALFIDGFVARLVLGSEAVKVLTGRTVADSFRVDGVRPTLDEMKSFFFISAIVFLATLFARKKRPVFHAITFGVAGSFVIAAIAIVLEHLGPKTSGYTFLGMLLWAVPLGVAPLAVFTVFKQKLNHASRRHLLLLIGFALLPHVYAFGTMGNYWVTAVRAGIFWIFAAVILVQIATKFTGHWRVFLPALAISQFVVSVLLERAIENPYRQQSLRQNAESVEVGPTSSRLKISKEAATYLRELNGLAKAHGFVIGTPIIDMTGRSPGAVFAMGAKAIGHPWLLGSYPGSVEFARLGLEQVPCESLAQAWILTEPDGPRPMDQKLLELLAIDLKGEYEDLGVAYAPSGDIQGKFRQHLHRPKDSEKRLIRRCKKEG